MEFKLTSTQQNFFTNIPFLDRTLWNFGAIQFFNEKYTYKQLNDVLNLLVENHENLRMRISKNNDTFYSYVEDFHYVDFPLIQASSFEELTKTTQDYVNAPIDFDGELVKCMSFTTQDCSGFFIYAHHIVFDGFGAQLMIRYLNNALKGQKTDFGDLESYENYIKKEDEYKQSKRYNRDKKFWEEQFLTEPICDAISQGRSEFNYTSSEQNGRLSSEVFVKIKKFCNENEISLNSFFDAICSIYVSRKYEVENFTLGVPVLNRTTAAEMNTIGLYMHILPLVCNIKPVSFIEFAKQTEDAKFNLFRHQKFTQTDIKELLKENGIEKNNLFDVAFSYQDFTPNENYEILFKYSNALSLPLEIHLQNFNEETHNLKIRYRTAYFSKNEIQIMLNSLVALAENAVENPDTNIYELEMVSAEEKKTNFNEFNNTNHTYNIPDNSTLYSLFEKASEENRDKVCIIANDKEITYKDFKNYAERIDNKIRNITDEKSVIAVICERSFEMYGAIYGIIRGGNAYLPIDPNYPQDRIDYILSNSNAKAVITQDKFCHLAGNTPCIDATSLLNSTEQPIKTECKAEENDTAYVIYTSGSTGNPKGAKISHKSAINRILWMHDFYPLEENDVILQKTPYTFDVSVWEHFWWGITGRTLCASKPDEHFLPAKILQETEKNKVTHLHFVPSVFDLFLTYLENNPDEQDKFNSVKYVFLSGEALTANHINRFYNIYDYNKVQLHNLYGPTECAVDVSYYPCVPTDTDPVPIGKPIYNTQLYITDKHLNPTPIGVIGELCIAGVNVGQGYLNNPELTAEKFIDNPFGEGKLYKTGDLAYWRNDGQICYVGRMDNQIKLNGQRIELGEIEKVISEVSGIESVAVIIKQNNGQDVLVAFCCGAENSINEILKHCEDKLPLYMIPGKFQFIEKMPLNPSGKLDRKALKNIEIIFDDTSIKEEPVTETEKIICGLFENTLYIDFVGRNENFFALGGTSLDMISILSENELKNISAAEFIANPTPEKLAKILDSDIIEDSDGFYTLRSVPSSTKALILFPYAGGDASAFAALAKELETIAPDLSLYYVDYLRSYDECEIVAQKISELAKFKEINVYSHCAGTAVALQIINILEEKGVSISHFISGGFIPPTKPSKKNSWNYIPKKLIQRTLVNAGAPVDKLSTESKYSMVEKFRKDTDFMTEYFYKFAKPINTKTSVIISKTDIFTKNYNDAKRLWKTLANDFDKLHYIDSNSHYFQTYYSETLGEIILNTIHT